MKALVSILTILCSCVSITQACVSINYVFVCNEFLSPVVKTFDAIPDSIQFTGVSSRELRADYSFDTTGNEAKYKITYDSSASKIHQGLKLKTDNGTITITGKTKESGTKHIKFETQNVKNNTRNSIKLTIKILSHQECNKEEANF